MADISNSKMQILKSKIALVTDPFNVIADTQMPFLAGAIDPLKVQQQFIQHLPPAINIAQLRAIRVIRHKPGKRCLIEYDLEIENPAASQGFTLIGKARAKGTDIKSCHVQQALWSTGFAANSDDSVSVPEPMGVIPAFQMWLQRKVSGVIATQLLPKPGGNGLAKRIAEAAYKLHQAGIPPRRPSHRMTCELQILYERLPLVLQRYPQWANRLEQILNACSRLAAATPEPTLRGIHRDFYPDQVIVDHSRLYLLDLDLYCQGDPGLDIGNFIGHITEQSLRMLGGADALADRENAMVERFVQLYGEAIYPAVQSYATLTLVRHIYLSTQFPERRPFTESLLELCEQRLATAEFAK